MRNLKQWEKVLVVAIFVFAVVQAAKAATPIKSWDMSGTPVQKIVSVPTNEPNYPAGRTNKLRTVLEDADGDIVFGIWREDNNEALKNPSVVNGALEFYGLQVAYIENVAGAFPTFHRIAFDFKPAAASITSSAELVYFAYSLDIRTEPHATNGTRLRAYLYYADGTTVNVKTSYSVVANQTYHVECWVADGYLYLSLDGVVLNEQWDKGSVQLTKEIKATVYPNLYIGAHPLGDMRPYTGSIDNIELSFYEPQCGDWGFYPTDFDQNCYVGIEDLAYLATTWLNCTDPANENCVQLQ